MKKLVTTIIIVLIYQTLFSQNCDLFFSEYLEGSSNNKAIEVYNNSGNTINLSNYKLYRFNNGSPTPSDSLQPVGTLAQGAVYIAGNPSAVVAILNESDTLHTITFFNGDDVLMIKNMATGDTLDIIGIIGVDPGTNWSVGTGATSEFTLVRMTSVTKGTTNWTQSVTEWDVYPQNTTTFLGSHTGNTCCINTFSNVSASACDSLVSPSGNHVWTSSGIYKDTLQNAAGCDSIITMNLTINSSYSLIHNDTICNGQGFTLPGLTVVYTAGTYVDTLISSKGCDSIITTILTVNPTSAYSFADTACGSYQWGGVFLNNSGIYVDTLLNANGCDSIVTLNLLIINVDTSVAVSGITLTSNQNNATYQWIDCSNGSAPIPGALNQSFTPSANGSYAVIIKYNGCIDTSACKNVLSVGILNNNVSSDILIYPNPAEEFLFVQHGNIAQIQSIEVFDISGRKAMSAFNITSNNTITVSLKNLEAGVYFISIRNNQGNSEVYRLVKK